MEDFKVGDKVTLIEHPRSRYYTSTNNETVTDKLLYGIITKINNKYEATVDWYLSDDDIKHGWYVYYRESGDRPIEITKIVIDQYDIKKIIEDLNKLEKKYE